MLVLEVGFKLNNDFNKYHNLLINNGFINIFNCNIRDIYYTNKNLDNMTENEMKNSCVRIRIDDNNLIVQNCKFNYQSNDVKSIENFLISKGYKKVFDTFKIDHHYKSDLIDGIVQLQEIENIGLVVYYDNSKYYNLTFEKQRKKLIDDLNLVGFKFKYTDLGLDKLRTLYYEKDMYSKNQND